MRKTDSDESGTEDPGEARPDGRRLLRMYQRRLERIRAEQARHGERAWRDLFRQLEQVLRQIHGSPRLMADAQIDRIIRRMRAAPDIEALNYELRLLAERLAELAGVPATKGGPQRQKDDSRGLTQDGKLRPNGRMRLRL